MRPIYGAFMLCAVDPRCVHRCDRSLPSRTQFRSIRHIILVHALFTSSRSRVCFQVKTEHRLVLVQLFSQASAKSLPTCLLPVLRWVIVTQDVRASPPLLKSPYGVGTWKVDTMGKAFRFIRLRSTGINGRWGAFVVSGLSSNLGHRARLFARYEPCSRRKHF